MTTRILQFILLISPVYLIAQDIQYSQYYANPLYLNPAFTGATPYHRAVVNHRLQWPELPKAFANYSASYDYNAPELNSGFGILFNADRAGSANLRHTAVALNYSYTINFDRKFVIKPGLSFGWVNRTVDYNRLLFSDQIEFGIDGAPSQDPAVNDIEGVSYLDLGAGLLAYSEKFWVGMSGFHLNEPNNSLLGADNFLPMKLTVHAGARFSIGNSAFRDIKRPSIAPSFIYKRQGDFNQLDVGASLHYAPLIMGLWYRGLPFGPSDVPDQINQDAVIMVVGVEFDRFEIGYSFDTNISELSSASGGAHEISIQYYFRLPTRPGKVHRSKKFLPCPAFINQLYN